MGWLNADDIYLPNALRIVGQIFQDHPQIDWITSGSINITDDDRLFIIQPCRKHLSRWTQILHRSPPPQQCTFWRRSLWERAGAHVVEEGRYMDCELWLRFYEHARPYLIDTIFGAWRLHAGSWSTQAFDKLYERMDQQHAPYLKQYLQRRPMLRAFLPLMAFYFRVLDRGILNRVFFELVLRRSRFLTLNLRTGRFEIRRPRGWLPQPWPMTIQESLKEPGVVHERAQETARSPLSTGES
jgi:hypothetical protein